MTATKLPTGYTMIGGEAAAAWWSWLLAEGVTPHSRAIASITDAGDIAIVVFNPFDETAEAARGMGWDGTSPVFRMSSVKRKAFGRALRFVRDEVASAWFLSRRPGRVYLLTENANFLLNAHRDGTFSVEPGTTDLERMEAGLPVSFPEVGA